MADTIKIGNLDISSFKVGSDDCKVYLGNTLLYPLVEPSLKWKATYSDSSVTSAECGSSSEIVGGEILPIDLVSVEIGDCVTSIGEHVFAYCDSLTSIDIPNSVTTIGEQAFFICSSLESIDIPDSVTAIYRRAFSNCSSMTSVTIGSGITYIRDGAFYSCPSLSSITIEATTPPTLDAGVFDDTNNCPIYVLPESVDAYKAGSGWHQYASRIQAIPNS